MNPTMQEHERLMDQGFSSYQATCLIGLRQQIAIGERGEDVPALPRRLRTTPDLRGIERLPERPRPIGPRRVAGKRPAKAAVTRGDLAWASLFIAGMYVIMAAAWGLK